MAAAVADSLVAPAGATRGRFGRGTPAAAVPFAVQFDGPTSQQISLYCPVTGTVAAGAKVLAWYRQSGASTWLGGVELYRSLPANAGLAGAVEYFAGMILGMQPGTAYDVRCDYAVTGQATQSVTASTTTRAWPGVAGTPTIVASPGTIASILAQTLAPGTVLYIPNGNYTLPNNAVIKSGGTAQAPVFVVGQSKTGAVLTRTWSGTAMEFLLQIQGSHVVLDGLGMQGSGVDSGQNSYCRAIAAVRVSGQTTPSQSITIRNCRARGFDVFDGSDEAVLGRLTYYNDIGGNNPPSLIGVVSTQGFQGQDGWSDTAFRMPGDGCEAFSNTVFGFGDTTKFTDAAHSAGFLGRACYGHRNLVLYATDDGVGELDDCARNCALYDNTVMGAATLFSADTTFGGPFLVARNVGINIARHPFKLEGTSQGVTVANNTLVERGRMTGRTHAIQMPSGANPIDWRFANNLIVTNVPGDAVQITSGNMPGLRVQNNGYTQDAGFQFGQGVRSATLAQAKIDRPAIHGTDVLVEAQPFATAVPLGADFTAQYTGNAVVALGAGSAARGAGVHIPGITDGYTGATPDIGAVITGRPAVAYGVPPQTPWAEWSALALPAKPAAGTVSNLGSAVQNTITADADERFAFGKVWQAWATGAKVELHNAAGELVDVRLFKTGGGHSDTGWDGLMYWSLRLHLAGQYPFVYVHQASPAVAATSPVRYTWINSQDPTYGENTLANGDRVPTSHHPYGGLFGFDDTEPGGAHLVLTRSTAVQVGGSPVPIGQGHHLSVATGKWARSGPLHPEPGSTVHMTLRDRVRRRLVRMPALGATDVYTADYGSGDWANLAWVLGTTASRSGYGWADGAEPSGVHHEPTDLYLTWNGNGQIRAFQPGNLAAATAVLNITGLPTMPSDKKGVGLHVRGTTGEVWLLDMTTAPPTGFYVLTPPSSNPLANPWTVTRRSFTGSSHLTGASGRAGNKGTFDIPQYLAELDAFMTWGAADAPVQIWSC